MTDIIDRGYWKEYPRLKPGQALPLLTPWRSASWIAPTWQRMVTEGYGANAAVHACVQRHNLAYQQPKPIVKNLAGDPEPTHPLQALLNRPNPLMSWNELALFISTYKCVGGQAYLWKQRARGGQVIALWPFHVGNIEVVPGRDIWIDSYLYDAGDGRKIRIESDDIVHLKWPSVDPDQPWQALPPLRAIAREVDTDSEATRYMYALLFNDATPRTIIEVPENGVLTPGEYDRMKAQFRQKFGGDNRGDVSILEGGAKMARLSLDMEELAFDALRKVPEARIASGFLVPVEYSGLNVGLEHSTYANVAEARAGFFQDTIAPLCALDDGELTADLAPEFGGGVTIERDVLSVPALQENEDAKYARVVGAWEAGLLGRKEARVKLGLPNVLPTDDDYVNGRPDMAPEAAQTAPDAPNGAAPVDTPAPQEGA